MIAVEKRHVARPCIFREEKKEIQYRNGGGNKEGYDGVEKKHASG